MNKPSTSVAFAIAAALAMGSTAVHAQATETPWSLELTPYFWGVGADGDLTVRGQEAKIDQSFSDTIDKMDPSGSLLGVLRYSHFLVLTQLDYVQTDTNNLDDEDAPDGGRLKTDAFLGTLGFGYSFGDFVEKRAVDVLIGGRYLDMEHKLTIDNVGKFKRDRDYLDPILIVRPSFRLGQRWRFNPTFSYGDGGDSENTWELQPQIQYQISDTVALRVGYRKVHYELKSDNDLNKWDGEFNGFILGLGGTFGRGSNVLVTDRSGKSKAEPVAMAPTPPPPPSAPYVAPQFGDSDHDGIADNLDKCQGTAAGEKVDAIGCGINVSIAVNFPTNSAELTPESNTELDRIVSLFNSTPVISGFVEGYTDSTGNAEYNKQLSQKRARAVADYLIAHGVSQDRVHWRGRGEANPVADNNTPEGRAQNRRVVLKRVDAEH
ncbi:MAG TPA: OmpA family protein [Steroidobacteraceae bacterium]|nr:OmpA family protein [Steroidobacteraceae bacterium]